MKDRLLASIPGFRVRLVLFCASFLFMALGTCRNQEPCPNILVAIADDWSWPHAGAYGDAIVETPSFDTLAREGILFDQAFVSSPSCTPSRAAILTGQWHWRLRESANLWSTLSAEFPVYPDLLEDAGYFVGYSGKGWGPGRIEPGGRTRNPAGPSFSEFQAFLQQRPPDVPFCFWFGSSDPHRPYDTNSGAAAGIPTEQIKVPPFLPESRETRNDLADYYLEVQHFDRQVGRLVSELQQRGELDTTIIVVTSDNGMPFPRAKASLYDSGTRVPLLIRWGGRVSGPRRIEDFVSLIDLAPTFLEAAQVAVPEQMTGRSLLPLLVSTQSGRIEPERDHVFTGKERHVPCQEHPDMGGTPMRAIRTFDFLYIQNFRPDRWPAGTPHDDLAAFDGSWYGDTDNGPSKSYIIDRCTEPDVRRFYEAAFEKRPARELYDLRTDPAQLRNLAGEAGYADVEEALRLRLEDGLRSTGDPRVRGEGTTFDQYPYYGGTPVRPGNSTP